VHSADEILRTWQLRHLEGLDQALRAEGTHWASAQAPGMLGLEGGQDAAAGAAAHLICCAPDVDIAAVQVGQEPAGASQCTG
jgi:hypothetical protein